MIACILLCAGSLAIASIWLGTPSFAQTAAAQEPTGSSVTIETANKFQQVVPATGAGRKALTIKNNNSDNCWVYIGGDKASKDNSIALNPGSSYVRYWPFASADVIQATCASGSDTLLVEYQ